MHPVDGALVGAVALLKQPKRVWDFYYGTSVRVGSPWQPKLRSLFPNNFNVASQSTRKFLAVLLLCAPLNWGTWLQQLGAHGAHYEAYLHPQIITLIFLQFSTFCDGTHLFYGLILGTQIADSMLFFGPHPLFLGSWITFLGFKFMDFVLFSFRCPELASHPSFFFFHW